MPSKTEKLAASAASLPSIPKELIDQFVSGPMSGEAVNDACLAFKKALIERALGAEMGLHLATQPVAPSRQPPRTIATAAPPKPC
jgi:hypothetical protein